MKNSTLWIIGLTGAGLLAWAWYKNRQSVAVQVPTPTPARGISIQTNFVPDNLLAVPINIVNTGTNVPGSALSNLLIPGNGVTVDVPSNTPMTPGQISANFFGPAAGSNDSGVFATTEIYNEGVPF